MKESQTQEGVTIRWDQGLNKKRIAWFQPTSGQELRLVPGGMKQILFHNSSINGIPNFFLDELLLRYGGDANMKSWECVGHVIRIQNEEVALELRSNNGCPTDITRGTNQTFFHGLMLCLGYSVDFVWKSTSFDRMQVAMKTFATNEKAMTSYLYNKLLGREVKNHLNPLFRLFSHFC